MEGKQRRTAVETLTSLEEAVDFLGAVGRTCTVSERSRLGLTRSKDLRDDTLEALTVEELLLELVESLAGRDEGLGALAVTATERRRDELEEGRS